MSSHILWSWVSLHFLSGLTQFLVDLLQGTVPVRLVVMPSTSWNRLFRCFEDCRVEVEGILVDTVFGEGDRLGVDVSEFPEALPVRLLVVPAGEHFSRTGVDLLGKGHDYRFVSLPPSCSLTSLLAIFWMLSVAIAISGVLVVFHTLEQKVGGSVGVLMRTKRMQTIQCSTSPFASRLG